MLGLDPWAWIEQVLAAEPSSRSTCVSSVNCCAGIPSTADRIPSMHGQSQLGMHGVFGRRPDFHECPSPCACPAGQCVMASLRDLVWGGVRCGQLSFIRQWSVYAVVLCTAWHTRPAAHILASSERGAAQLLGGAPQQRARVRARAAVHMR